MKKKNTFLGVALLIAVLVLGVGYAMTINGLKIVGTATATESESNFIVKFTEVYKDGDNVSANIDTSDATGKTALMDVTLGTVGEVAEAEFTITNQSAQGINAIIDQQSIKVTSAGGATFNDEYFDVSYSFGDTENIELAQGDSATVVVTVELKKAVVGDDIPSQFFITLDNITAKAAE